MRKSTGSFVRTNPSSSRVHVHIVLAQIFILIDPHRHVDVLISQWLNAIICNQLGS
jgi:hypothetical protein